MRFATFSDVRLPVLPELARCVELYRAVATRPGGAAMHWSGWAEVALRYTNAITAAIAGGHVVQGSGQHEQLAARARDAWFRYVSGAARDGSSRCIPRHESLLTTQDTWFLCPTPTPTPTPSGWASV